MSEQPPTAAVGTTPAPPVVSGRPEEVADGVFVVPDGRVPLVPNIGVVVGERAALVVDTGMGPRNGALAREIAKELAGGRPLFLTLTHFHPEHGYGAQRSETRRSSTTASNAARCETRRSATSTPSATLAPRSRASSRASSSSTRTSSTTVPRTSTSAGR